MTAQVGRSEEAMAIYQDLLNRIAASYFDNDFEAYAEMIAVPHKVSSYGPVAHIKTRGHLRKLFDDIRTYQASKAITDFVRVCRAARFSAEDEIDGMHETRMLSGAQNVDRPYPVRSILRFLDGKWMVCSSDNAIEPNSGLGPVLLNAARSGTAEPE